MPADAAEIVRLADRVEQATGPDRELDGVIDRLFNARPVDGDYDEGEGAFWRVQNGWSGLLVRPDGFARDSFSAVNYTASLDAAMTLVPEDCLWTMDSWSSSGWSAGIWKPSGRRWVVNSDRGRQQRTPALALTAAALRAQHDHEVG